MHERQDYTEYSGTGEYEPSEEAAYKIITYPIGIYEVKIRLDESNVFVGVAEVKANKDFMTFRQGISKTGVHDVDEYYKDDKGL